MRFRIFDIIRTANTAATALAAAAFVTLLIKAAVLNRIESPFPVLYELGILVDAILTSVVASYVFYLFVVHLKERSDQAILSPFITAHAWRVVNVCKRVLSDVGEAASHSLELRSLTEDTLRSALEELAPYSQTALHNQFSYANWFQYFESKNSYSKRYIAKLFEQLVYLDPRLIAQLAAIDDCPFFRDVTETRYPRREYMAAVAPIMFDYCRRCKELEDYLQSQSNASAA